MQRYYYLMFFDGCPDQYRDNIDIALADCVRLGYECQAVPGAHDWSTGWWLIMERIEQASQIADNYAVELFRVNDRSDVMVENVEGDTIPIGHIELTTQDWAVEGGTWFEHDSNIFSIEYNGE